MAAGWFRLTYDGTETEEVEQEDLFLGVRADANDDYELVAFRADGADIKDEIRLDPVAFEAAIRNECVNAIATEVVEVFDLPQRTLAIKKSLQIPKLVR